MRNIEYFSLPYLRDKVAVEMSYDEDENSSIEELAVALQNFVEHFQDENVYNSLSDMVARDTTEDACSQSDYEATEGDIIELKEALRFKKLGVFPGCYVLHFDTPSEPSEAELDICIQMTDDFEFEDYV